MALDIGTLWAALAAAVVTMAVGMLWYGVLFEKPWMRAMGLDRLTPAERQRKQKEAMPGYLASIVGAMLAAVLLDFLVDWAQPGSPYADQPGWIPGLSVALAGYVAFHVVPSLVSRFFEPRHRTVLALDLGYWGVLALAWGALAGGLS